MRKKREKPVEQAVQSQETEQPQYVDKPPVWDEAQLKTFEQQAIEVLNYLDSIGEGIYDEGRKPGMYLHTEGTEGILPTHIKSKFRKQKKQKEFEDSNSDDVSTEMLKNIFKNKKK